MGVCCVYAWSGERRESPCVKRHTNVVVRCVRVVCGCVVWLRVGACADGRAAAGGSPYACGWTRRLPNRPHGPVGVGEEVIAIAGSCFCAAAARWFCRVRAFFLVLLTARSTNFDSFEANVSRLLVVHLSSRLRFENDEEKKAAAGAAASAQDGTHEEQKVSTCSM